MNILRTGALASVPGLCLAGLLIACLSAPEQAAASDSSLYEQRQELKGLSRILERRSGEQPAVDSALLPGNSAAFAAVPQDHWAYPALQHLAEQGLLEGYPDGFFKGDRPLSRYEFSQAMASLTPLTGTDKETQLAAAALRLEFGDQFSAVQDQLSTLNEQLAELQERLEHVRESQE